MSLHALGFNLKSPFSPRSRTVMVSHTTSSPTNSNVQDSKEVLLQRLQDLTSIVTESKCLSEVHITELHQLVDRMEAISQQGSWEITSTPSSRTENGDYRDSHPERRELSILKRRNEANKRKTSSTRKLTSTPSSQPENSEGHSPLSIRGRREANTSEPTSGPVTPKRFWRTPSTTFRTSSMSTRRPSAAKHSPTIRSPLGNKDYSSSAKPSILDDDVFKTPPASMNNPSPLPKFDFESAQSDSDDAHAKVIGLLEQELKIRSQVGEALAYARSATSKPEMMKALTMIRSANWSFPSRIRTSTETFSKLAEEFAEGERMFRARLQAMIIEDIEKYRLEPVDHPTPMNEAESIPSSRIGSGSEFRVQKNRSDYASLEERRARQDRLKNYLMRQDVTDLATRLATRIERLKGELGERKEEIDTINSGVRCGLYPLLPRGV